MEKLVFTYGTLCKGFGNHSVIQHSTTELLGEAKTSAKYTLMDGGFPIVERGGETSVKGQVFKVKNPDTLKRVYSLEGYSGTPSNEGGDNWYDIDTVETEWGTAEIFVMNQNASGRNNVIEHGDWRKNH